MSLCARASLRWWEFLLQLRHGSPYDASKLYDNQGESMNDLARSALGSINRAALIPQVPQIFIVSYGPGSERVKDLSLM